MKSTAPAFIAFTAIGTAPLPVITMAGRSWPSDLRRSIDQRKTTHPGHQGVDQKAPVGARTVGFVKGSAIGKKLHRIPILLQQIGYRFPDSLVVVNDKNSGRLTRSHAEGQLLDRVWRRSPRFGKESLYQACQIHSPNRLVEMHAAAAGDVAQALG
jgi:hypothetical protein